MKIKFGLLLLTLLMSGCGFPGNSPMSTVGKFLKLAEKSQNIEALEKLYSERAKRELGAEKILVDVISAVDIGTKIAAIGESTPFLKPEETLNGVFATVTFYTNPGFAEKNDKENRATVLLEKENGEWKIYSFGQSGEPNPKRNSIFASELTKTLRVFPDLFKTRLIGKTVIVEGDKVSLGMPDDDNEDSGSIDISASYDRTNDNNITCRMKSGIKVLYDKNEKTPLKNIKVKGTIIAKDPNDIATAWTAIVLDNCTVQ
jgi:hypothetical protein